MVVVIALMVLGGSLALIPLIGVELMPSADESEVRVTGEMQIGSRLDVLDGKFEQIEAIVRKSVPEIENVVTRVGGSSWRGTGSHTGRVRIALKPQSQRSRSSEQIADHLRGKLANIPGVLIRTRAGQGLFLLRMGSSDADNVEVEVRGYDLEIADVLAQQVKKIVENVEGITDAKVSRESGRPKKWSLSTVRRQRI